jgi:hypothetical protein
VWWDAQVSSPVTTQSRKSAGFWIDTAILNTLGAHRCCDWPVNSALSYSSYLTRQHCHFWRKKSLAFLLDLYLYFPNISLSCPLARFRWNLTVRYSRCCNKSLDSPTLIIIISIILIIILYISFFSIIICFPKIQGRRQTRVPTHWRDDIFGLHPGLQSLMGDYGDRSGGCQQALRTRCSVVLRERKGCLRDHTDLFRVKAVGNKSCSYV